MTEWTVTVLLTAPDDDFDADGIVDQVSQALEELPGQIEVVKVSATCDDESADTEPEPPVKKGNRRRTRGEK